MKNRISCLHNITQSYTSKRSITKPCDISPAVMFSTSSPTMNCLLAFLVAVSNPLIPFCPWLVTSMCTPRCEIRDTIPATFAGSCFLFSYIPAFNECMEALNWIITICNLWDIRVKEAFINEFSCLCVKIRGISNGCLLGFLLPSPFLQSVQRRQ